MPAEPPAILFPLMITPAYDRVEREKAEEMRRILHKTLEKLKESGEKPDPVR